MIFADQMFIDPMFFGIFVCGPLQSFVVDVCTNINPHNMYDTLPGAYQEIYL